jgi:predicted PurR-regulated permease PerM
MDVDPLAPGRVVRTLAIAAVFGVVCWALYLARAALLLIYVSALLAIGFTPVVRLIERLRMMPFGIRRVPRWLAILSLYLAFVALLLGLLLLVIPPVVQQATEFSRSLPSMLDRGQGELVRRGLLAQPITLGEAVARAPQGSDAVSAILGTVWGVVGGLIGVFTLLILTYYLLVDADAILEAFLRLCPPQNRQMAAQAAREISRKIAAWLGGHLILGAVMGTAAAVGLFLIGVPYFYVVAVVAAVGELVPIVGPLVAGVAAVSVAATVSFKLAVGALAYFVVLQQVESNVLVPKIMERQVGLRPVTVIIALLIGSELHGVVGAILAVPTAAILLVVVDELTVRVDLGA